MRDCVNCKHHVLYDYKNMTYGCESWECKFEPIKNDLGVDCISRAEAIKCLECDFDITGKENMKTVVNYINSAHDKIVNLPRVKQEPRKGHWIADFVKWGDVVTTVDGYRCDKCNAFDSDKDNYCPNCGAKMEEVEE